MSIKKRGMQSLVLATAIVLVPTIALAAGGTFTSATGQAAVKAVNSSSHAGAAAVVAEATGGGGALRFGVNSTAGGPNGIGVQGTGSKWGVYSNGPLGVASGKALVCTGCVTSTDLTLTLVSGQTESGVFASGGDAASPANLVGVGITFPRPLAQALPTSNIIDTDAGANVHCPGPGQAAAGYLCLYPAGPDYFDVNPSTAFYSFAMGVQVFWTPNEVDPYVAGIWTLTAP
jgi:hypothetical protein